MAGYLQTDRSRAPTIALVALLHIGIGYALVSGLATKIAKIVSPTMTTYNVPTPVEPKDVPPPPKAQPSRNSAEPARAARTIDITPPVFTLELPQTLPMPPVGHTEMTLVDPTAAIPAPPPGKARAATTRGDRGAWITTQDYPASAIRAEESGTVGIRAAIDVNGRVIGCTVTQSSGSAALDVATCKLYQRRARFTPALDEAGAPTTAVYSDRVRWQLPE